MGLGVVQWSLEAAGVGPVPGPVVVAEMGEVEDPVPRSRPHRNSGSDCEVEAVTAEAGGMKEGEGRGRSLLARLLMGSPAVAGGPQHRAGLGSGGGAVA